MACRRHTARFGLGARAQLPAEGRPHRLSVLTATTRTRTRSNHLYTLSCRTLLESNKYEHKKPHSGQLAHRLGCSRRQADANGIQGRAVQLSRLLSDFGPPDSPTMLCVIGPTSASDHRETASLWGSTPIRSSPTRRQDRSSWPDFKGSPGAHRRPLSFWAVSRSSGWEYQDLGVRGLV